MGSEGSTKEEVGFGKNEDEDGHEIIRRTAKVGESAGKYVEKIWACIEKRRRIRRQESDGDAGKKKERKTEADIRND